MAEATQEFFPGEVGEHFDLEPPFECSHDVSIASILGQVPSISQSSRVVSLYAVTRLLQSAGSLKQQAALGAFMAPDWAPPKRQLPKR